MQVYKVDTHLSFMGNVKSIICHIGTGWLTVLSHDLSTMKLGPVYEIYWEKSIERSKQCDKWLSHLKPGSHMLATTRRASINALGSIPQG